MDDSEVLNFNEQYFRPSKLVAINIKDFDYKFFDKYFGNYNDIKLPNYLFNSEENTIINYFSLLREASSITTGGCGSIGNSKAPYPISYNFFNDDFKKRVDYNNYLSIFNEVGHINLIKLHRLYNTNSPDIYRYFFEIETIEPSVKGNTSFAYYYGFIYLIYENGNYKISDIDLRGEDFLCAPYHGWMHNAEFYVDTTYGDWCHLIKERHPTEKDGYIKNIYVTGTDGNDYKFQFIQLTNGTDVQVNQFIKNKTGVFIPTVIDVNKCIPRFRGLSRHRHCPFKSK
ncbi:hypothetical protein KYB31_01790 [Clostridium felsineum]|uniref:hypothetical protein n=1 Tax=Clostridium felsineum TaxID=36839 RepID=UPI00214D389C|nr:hypothetical protein [Clostridium felsineum]MCR3757725.1 hypothetical protein [Clostridium felsineum]